MNYYQKKCDGIMHTIKKGDTLYRLSRMYSVSVDDIMDANPQVNVYNLQEGSSVCIPMTMPSAVARPVPDTVISGQPEMPGSESPESNVIMPTQPVTENEMPDNSYPDNNYMDQEQLFWRADDDNDTFSFQPDIQPSQPDIPEAFVIPGMPLFTQTEPETPEAMEVDSTEEDSMEPEEQQPDWMVIQTYQVIRGDTINSVLADFDMDFDTFARLNPQIMPIPLKPGDTIFVKQQRR